MGSVASSRRAPRSIAETGRLAVHASSSRVSRSAWPGSLPCLVASKQCLQQHYSTILFLGSNGGGKSVSPSISRKSISAVRHICEIGTSFGLPSNGFSVLSPTRSSEVYIQEINTLKGMTSQTMFPLITPSTLSLSLSNSLSNPKGRRRQNNLMKKELTVAYCLGYGKSLRRSHLPCCKRKSLTFAC